MIQYCANCCYPINHPLNITFNKENICSGCLIHQEKDQLNWTLRFNKLKKIVSTYRNFQKDKFDCIVPISGGKDSYFIVHIVKKILNLNPLLVNYNTHYNSEVGIRNLSYLKTKLGCAYFNLTISPKKIKKITYTTLKKFGNIYWHCIAGQTVFPVQIACKFNIPLIIWGAHQGIDQVGKFSHLDEVEMTRKYRKEHDLFNYEAEDLFRKSNLKKNDLNEFIYPDDNEIFNKGIRGIYLNNFIRWDTKKQHELMIKKYNYETMKLSRTFDSYNNIDCLHYAGLHDYFKYLKLGYSLITDHCSREIRLKRLTRNDAIKKIKIYRDNKVNNVNFFLKWIGLNYRELNYYFDKHRNTKIWEKIRNNWNLKNDISEKKFNKEKVQSYKKINFNSNSRKSKRIFIKKPILFGKGMDL